MTCYKYQWDIIASQDIYSIGRLNLTLQISTERLSVLQLVTMRILIPLKFSSNSSIMFRNCGKKSFIYTYYASHLIAYILHKNKEFHWKYLFSQRNHTYLWFQSTNVFKQGKKSQFLAPASGLVKETSSFQSRGLGEVSKCTRTAWVLFRWPVWP